MLLTAVIATLVLVGAITMRTEHLTMSEKDRLQKELDAVNKQLELMTKNGDFEKASMATARIEADLRRKQTLLRRKLQEPITAEPTLGAPAIILIVIGIVIVFGLGYWAYTRWATPAYPATYGARRR